MAANSIQNSNDETTTLSKIKLTSEYTNTLTSLIGNTPLVEISKLPFLSHLDESIKVYAKLEMFNFGGSVKDRPALFMINRAEEVGILRKGKS